jgi:hypothetical protein
MNGTEPAAPDARARLLDLINANWTTQAIAVACRFDLPDRLAERSWSASELAKASGVDADALARLLRALVTLDVCREAEDGRFSLGPCGELLARDHPRGLRNWALLNGGSMWSRWQGLGDRVCTGAGSEGGVKSLQRFDRLGIDPDEGELFYGAMSELTRRLGDAMAVAIEPPDGALIVDVGGGSGELLAGVLARHPNARGLLFDLPAALERAGPVLARHGVADRCRLQAGNFFDGLPTDGDVYLMKSIVHDWDDASAMRLLQRCSAAMHRTDARLFIIERMLPEQARATPEHAAVARSDLNMLVGLAGRERSRREYQALCEQAGLALRGSRPLSAGFEALEVHGLDACAEASTTAIHERWMSAGGEGQSTTGSGSRS